MTVHRVICDCDNTMGVPGKPVDDGQTILYLLGRPDIELVGITTTFGNGTIDEVHGATEWLLRTLGREDIPLFKGAGSRGEAPGSAAHFLADMAARYPGEISLLAIGPLGNLRAAAEVDPAFFHNIKQVSIMGGYLGPLKGAYWQNVPELNLSQDPEAAHVVFHASCAITLMNANVCQQAPFGLPELERMSTWRGTPIYDVLRDWVLRCKIDEGTPGDYLWDLLPALYLSYPELFDRNMVWLKSSVADLETGTLILGEEGQGAMVNMPSRIRDVDRFYDILYEAWAQARRAAEGVGLLR